jgi:hypothetical protein
VTAFSFWQKWLLAVGLLIITFGLALSFFSQSPLFDFLFNNQVNPAFWSTATISDPIKMFQQWIYGVSGATVAGWGVFITFMAHIPFKRKEPWAWYCIILGMFVWFTVDTSISIYFKVYINAALNIVLFVLVMLPTVFSRRYFFTGIEISQTQ